MCCYIEDDMEGFFVAIFSRPPPPGAKRAAKAAAAAKKKAEDDAKYAIEVGPPARVDSP